MKRRRSLLIIVVFLTSIVVGCAASYLWPNVTIPVAVDEPIEILDYSPSNLNLFPGERENITILVYNHAPLNYTVIFDFQLNDTMYQKSFIRSSDYSYPVPPGECSLSGWLLVEPDAPQTSATLTISVKRVRPGVTPPSQANLLEENWDSLANWIIDPRATLVEINPPGQLHTYGGFPYRRMPFPEQFTIEFRLKVDSFADGFAFVQVYTSRAFRFLAIYGDRIRFGSGNTGFEWVDIITDNDWHVWTMLIDVSIEDTKIYRDGVFLTTFTTTEFTDYPLVSRIVLGSFHATTCETHWDYVYISTGLLP